MTGGAEVPLRRWEAPGVVEPHFCMMCAEMTRVGGGRWPRTGEELTRQCGQRDGTLDPLGRSFCMAVESVAGSGALRHGSGALRQRVGGGS